jgi:acyl carrier protein
MPDQAIDLARLRTLLVEHLHVEVPSADADLLETGVLDSLQLVDLLLLIEQHFGRRIAIEAIDLDDLRSLTSLAQLLATPAATAAGTRAAGRGDAAAESVAEPLHGKRDAARRGTGSRG